MGAISNFAIGLEDASKVTKQTYTAFVEYLIAEKYCPLDGSCALSVDYYDEKKDDEISEEHELEDTDGIAGFLSQHDLKHVRVVLSEESKLGEALCKEAEKCGGKLNEEFDAEDEIAAMSPGFGFETDANSGDELGWMFYVSLDGEISDDSELDAILMKHTTHFKKIRAAMEKIFATKTRVFCPVTG